MKMFTEGWTDDGRTPGSSLYPTNFSVGGGGWIKCHSAVSCLLVNPVMVNNFDSLCNCKTVSRAPDSMIDLI